MADAIARKPGLAFHAAGLSPCEVNAASAPTFERLQSLPPLERRPIAFATRFGELETPTRLDDPAYAESARAVAAEIAEMPSLLLWPRP